MYRAKILKAVIGCVAAAAALGVMLPGTSYAQQKCGAQGQRPCKIWERIPSCNRGLVEDFVKNRCVKSASTARRKDVFISRPYTDKDHLAGGGTVLNFCNRSSKPDLFVAIAYWTDAEWGWVSTGWYRVPNGRCNSIQLGKGYSGTVYIYGSASDGSEWSGEDARFCVKSYEQFDIDNSDRLECRSRDYSIVGMRKVAIKRGANTWNFDN